MEYVKGLAKSGDRTFVFENAATRERAAEVGTARRVRAEHERSAVPDGGDASCFFREELARWREADPSTHFQRYARAVAPLTSSLAQLVHHRDAVVTTTVNALNDQHAISWRALLALLGVLARDLRGDMYSHYPAVAAALRALVDASRPEVTAEVFRTAAFLFKYLARPILADVAWPVRFNEWSVFLAAPKPYIRDMAASALAVLLRRHTPAALRAQVTSLLRGMSVDGAAPGAPTARSPELKDGVATLLFELLRGVRGGLHSASPALLKTMFVAMSPKRSRVVELISEPPASTSRGHDASDAAVAKRRRPTAAAVHVDGINRSHVDGHVDGISRGLAATWSYQQMLALRAELVAHVLRRTAEHVSSVSMRASGTAAQGGEGAAVVWDALHDAMDVLAAEWAAMEDGRAIITTEATQNPLSKRLRGAAGVFAAASVSTPPLASAAAHEHYAACLSLYTGQVTGILTQWVTHRSGSRVPPGAPRLADTLRALFAPRTWLTLEATHVTRAACLQLLLASWRFVCLPPPPSVTRGDSGAARRLLASALHIDNESDGDADVVGEPIPPAASDLEQRDSGSTSSDDHFVDNTRGDDAVQESRARNSSDRFSVVATSLAVETSMRVSRQLLGLIFALGDNLVASEHGTASIDPVAAALTASMAGLPDTSINPPRVAPAATLVLSFARELLTAASTGKFTATGGAHTLNCLLPRVRAYVRPMLEAAGRTASTAPVVWSLLLSVRDSVSAVKRPPSDSNDDGNFGGALTHDGLLVLGDNESDTVAASVSTSIIACLAALLRPHGTLTDAIAGLGAATTATEETVLDIASPALIEARALVEATGAIALPAVDAMRILLQIVAAMQTGVDSKTVPEAARSSSTILMLHNIRALALLNASRFALAVARNASNMTSSKREEALLTFASTTVMHSTLRWAQSCCENATHDAINITGSSATMLRPQHATRLNATALTALNAAATYAETLRSLADSPNMSGRMHRDDQPEGASSMAANALSNSSFVCTALPWLIQIMTHPDRSIRLCALRLCSAFTAPTLLYGGAAVPVTYILPGASVAVTSKSSRQPHTSARDSSASASPAPAAFVWLLDEGLVASSESTFEGASPAIELLLKIEALPPTLAHERSKALLLTQLSSLLASRRLPPHHVALSLSALLGGFYTRFAPVWTHISAALAVAAATYPRTTWAAIARQLYVASLRRTGISEDFASDAEAGRAAVSVVDAVKSRSQARSERERARVVPLRLAFASAAAAASAASTNSAYTTDPLLTARARAALREGLVGADSRTPVAVSAAADGVAAFGRAQAAHRGASSTVTMHVNDFLPLSLGAGGSTDAETHHRVLLGALAAAPLGFAEARSRTLVPLFLAFLRDDVFVPAAASNVSDFAAADATADDPDAVELQLNDRIAELSARNAATDARARQKSSLSSAVAASGNEIERLLSRLVSGEARTRGSLVLPRAAATARLLSYLTVLETFRGWGAVFGQPVLAAALRRLLARADGGIAASALRLLLAMKPPDLVPYGDTLQRLLRDDTASDTMARFSLSPTATAISPSHRPAVLPIVLQLLYGRLLQRRGASKRGEAQATRRAALLAYAAAIAPNEVAPLIYLVMRPFLLPVALEARRKASDLSAPGTADFADYDFTVVVSHSTPPSTYATVTALIEALSSSFIRVTGGIEGGKIVGVANSFVSAPRALGFLNLCADLVRHLGSKLAPSLHLVLGAVLSLLNECGAGGATAAATAGSVPGGTTLHARAREIRTLSLMRLRDIIVAHPTYDYTPWAPTLRAILAPALPLLPVAISHAPKPNALLMLLAALVTQPSLRHSVIISTKEAIPALFACLSAGMGGAREAHAAHAAATVGDAYDKIPAPAAPGRRAASGDGPSTPVLATVFSAIEALLGIDSDASNHHMRNGQTGDFYDEEDSGPPAQLSAALAAHIPYLLRHLVVRLESSTTTLERTDSRSSDKCIADDDDAPIVVPALRRGARAFARRQLVVLARVSRHAAAAFTMSPATGAKSDPSISTAVLAQLATLLLPHLKRVKPSTARRGAAGSHAAEDDGSPVMLVLRTLEFIAPLLPAPIRYLPFLSSLLAPGPRSLDGAPRAALLRVLAALAMHPSLSHLEVPFSALARTATQAARRVGELDYDAVLGALADVARPEILSGLLAVHVRSAKGGSYSVVSPMAPATHSQKKVAAPSVSMLSLKPHVEYLAAAPALLHQLAYLMHDRDVAARTSASNTLTVFIRAAATSAVAGWRARAVVPYVTETSPSVVDVPSMAPSSVNTNAEFDEHAAALYTVAHIVVPDVRASLGVASPAVRRGFVNLLADIVTAFEEYGLSPAGSAEAKPTRIITHPDLHADLLPLRNATDPEADIFNNLTHVQVHRRARALLRLASLVETQQLTTHSITSIVLPLTLHALYDEAGGGDDVVETRGGRHGRIGGAKFTGAYVGGLHAEAIKLIAAVARALPWGPYLSTMRSLLRQARAASAEASTEKVLVRAVAAIAEGWHFNTVEPAVPGGLAATTLAMSESDMCHTLVTAMSAGNAAAAHRLRYDALAIATSLPVQREGTPSVTLTEQALPAEAKAAHISKSVAVAEVDDDECDVLTVRLREIAQDATTAEALLPAGRVANVSTSHRSRGDSAGTEAELFDGAIEEAAAIEGDNAQLEAEKTDVASISGDTLGNDDDDATVMTEGGNDVAEDAESTTDVAPAVAAELVRRGRLMSLASHILPQLSALLFRPVSAGSTKHRGAASEAGEVRAPVALALVRLFRTALPTSVFRGELPGLLAKLCAALRSRDQDFRDTARSALGRVAGALGPEHLATVVDSISAALTAEGYMIHVMGHALHAVLDALASEMKPTTPAQADDDAADNINIGQSSGLVAALPRILTLVMDDVLGEAAEARAADSGYAPKTALREAKRCRGYESLEIVARCIPFLPSTAVHTLSAPIIAAFEDAAARGTKNDVPEALLRRLLAGLSANPSVSPTYLLRYVHGICCDFLHVSMAPLDAHEAGLPQAPQPPPCAPSAATALSATTMDVWIAPPASKKRGGKSTAPVAQWQWRAPVTASTAPVEPNADPAPGTKVGYVALTAAMRQRGAGVTTVNPLAYTVLPEPRVTGFGRDGGIALAGKKAANAGAVTAADVPMGAFALSLLLSALRRGLVSAATPQHRALLDPFVPLILRILQGGSNAARVLVLVHRLLAVLLPAALPTAQQLGPALSRAIFTGVDAAAGGGSGGAVGVGTSTRSELAVAALKSSAVLIRSCRDVRVNDEQLHALLAILRADLPLPGRQQATFSLLKAIIGRRLLAPEVYDVMEEVGAQLVTSLRPGARALCASTLLAFLMSYPMSDARLGAHLDFFVRNLGYAVLDGRLAVLDLLAAVVARFPQAVLDERSGYLLLPLTVRLVGEEDTGARAGVGALIKALFRAISTRAAQALVSGPLLAWASAKQADAGLRRAGHQLIGLVAESRPDAFALALQAVLAALTTEMRTGARRVAEIEAALSAEHAAADASPNGKPVSLMIAGADHDEGDDRRAVLDAEARVNNITAGGGLREAADDLDSDSDADEKNNAVSATRPGSRGHEDDDSDADDNKRSSDKDERTDAVAAVPLQKWMPAAAVPQPQRTALADRFFPIGQAGGGDAVFGSERSDAARARAKSTQIAELLPSASGVAPAARRRVERNTVAVTLVWEPVYYAVLAAEKLLRACPDRLEALIAAAATSKSDGSASSSEPRGRDGKGSASVISLHAIDDDSGAAAMAVNVAAGAVELLRYPHAWVRLTASRALGLCLARRKLDAFAPQSSAQHSMAFTQDPAGYWLHDISVVSSIARRLVGQLSAPDIGDTAAEEAAKNLVTLALALHRLTPLAERNTVTVAVATVGATHGAAFAPDAPVRDVRDYDDKADDDGNEDAVDDDDIDDSSESDEDTDYVAAKPRLRDPLYGLVDYACSVAARNTDASVAAVLKWTAAIASTLPGEEMLRYLIPVVRLLYRITESDDATISAATRALATEATELLAARVGSEAFTHALSAERARVSSIRLRRRHNRAMLKVMDPAAALRAKEKRQRAKLRQRRRKADAFREAKGQRVDAGSRKRTRE